MVAPKGADCWLRKVPIVVVVVVLRQGGEYMLEFVSLSLNACLCSPTCVELDPAQRLLRNHGDSAVNSSHQLLPRVNWLSVYYHLKKCRKNKMRTYSVLK